MSSPFISGFTFIKNGLTLGYPIRESIQSIDPLCDEIIINVGFDNPELKDDDGTYEYLRDSFPGEKYKFLKSWWDPAMTKQGLILSQQTNIALEKARGKFCQYIQADEALHENDLNLILNEAKTMHESIDGLVYNYFHFYGNVDVIRHTRVTYRKEVRLIRNGKGIKSWLDAQGFKYLDNSKILCKEIPAHIYHYGWARADQVMKKKVVEMNRLYHGNKADTFTEFEFQKVWGLRPFIGTHPEVMSNWIEKNKNDIDVLNLKTPFAWKNFQLALSDFVEKMTGWRIGEYQNYIIK